MEGSGNQGFHVINQAHKGKCCFLLHMQKLKWLISKNRVEEYFPDDRKLGEETEQREIQ